SHFQTILEGVVADPDLRLADCPLLTATERQQLLVEWNDTAHVFRSQESGVRSQEPEAGKSETDGWSLHELVEAQVARTPDTIAVVFDATNDQRPTTTADEGRRTKDEGRRTKDEQDSFIVHRSSFIVTYAELNRR